ncbi:MAG TPA: hypothetical protein VHU85_05925 [Acidimicrobiales bacterium]|jgi:hypothetical protein|nr:hypothetical protein [Acidimicrobiales bacterium]
MVVMDIDRRELRTQAPGQEAGRGEPTRAPGWTPLAGNALLDRIRVTGRPRPLADPERVARLRESLEQGLGLRPDPASVPPPSHPASIRALLVTKDRLTRALRGQPQSDGEIQPPTTALACGALIDGLFQQLITIGTIGDPMRDGLDGLGVDERQAQLVTWIENLPASERGALAAEVVRQSADLVTRWPRLDPAWLPRTQVPMRVGVAGGSVELSGRVDLAIGRPGLGVASVAIVEVKSGVRRPEHRHDLHFYALLETLRSPAPPFAVATYYSRTGELDVDPVSDELLASAARRTAAGIRALGEQAIASSDPIGGAR